MKHGTYEDGDVRLVVQRYTGDRWSITGRVGSNTIKTGPMPRGAAVGQLRRIAPTLAARIIGGDK